MVSKSKEMESIERTRLFAFFGLVLQNSSSLLLKSMVGKRQDVLIANTVLVVTEVVKCLLSLACLMGVDGESLGSIARNRVARLSVVELGVLTVPALSYLVQNVLIFYALTTIEGAVFQVCYQLKIVFAAILANVVLKQKIGSGKWYAIAGLFTGVVIICVSSNDSMSSGSSDCNFNTYGLLATIGASFLSAFGGTFMESALQSTKTEHSLWFTNLMISFMSVIIAGIGCVVMDGPDLAEYGFFAGWDVSVWLLAFLQAIGGLLTVAVLKYSGNLVKGFAASLSMILSSLVSMALFSFRPCTEFIAGSSIVLLSIISYNQLSTQDRKVQQSVVVSKQKVL